MSTHAHTPIHTRVRLRLGGSRGNELLTSVNAAVLLVLLAVQLVTVLALDSMIEVHLFVGVVLLGPVVLKLASTGYRFFRYYTGSREYREKGPPPLMLRVIAPVFVAATIGLFSTGVLMLVNGEGEGAVRDLHVTSFWLWIACFVVHVAFNARQVAGNLRSEWFARARQRITGAELRAGLVLASVLGGVMVALALISKITGYDVGD